MSEATDGGSTAGPGEGAPAEDPRVTGLEGEVARWRARAEQAERLLVLSPAPVYIFDVIARRLLFTSGALARMLGYQPEEIVQMGAEMLPTLMHPDDLPRALGEFEPDLTRREDGAVVTFAYRMRHRSGEWRWIEACAVVLSRTADGALERFLAAVQDITERKRVEEAMREREAALARANAALEEQVAERTAELRKKSALLASVIDHMPAAFFIKDLEGRYLLVNRRNAELLGHEPAELVGKLDAEVLPPAMVDAWRVYERKMLTEGTSHEGEDEADLADGTHVFLSIGFPIRDEQGQVFAFGGMSTDITERKRAAQEREALQAQIIEAQRAAIRELSTPLIPLAEGVVVMPVVGAIDSVRAQQIMETLLSGIVAQQAQVAILDITGLQTVDTQIADALLRAARAAGLLGAEVMLTGVRPEVAQVLVQLGVDMSSISTQSTLQAGIAAALRRPQARARGQLVRRA